MKRTTLRALSLAAALGALGPAAIAPGQTFHTYVANGDSITAGVQGNCLVARNQRTAFPVLVANSLGISDFQEPLMGESGTVTNPASACLGATLSGTSILPGPVSQPGAPQNATLARPYDNLGIPSAKTADLVDLKVSNPAAGGVQAAAALVLRNFPGSPFANMSAVDETNLRSPDLVTLWIGSNDVLPAALSGVAIDGVTMTPKPVFDAKYGAVVSGLQASGRTLVFLNVPDVAAIPFTTTVPIEKTVGTTTIRFLGPRTTSTCSTPPCPLPDGSLLTLQAQPLLNAGHGLPLAAGGLGDALPDGGFDPSTLTLTPGVVLYPEEIAAIRAKTADINATIASQASAAGAILVDIHSIYEDVHTNGYTIGGITLTQKFLQGGLFSADGFHPSNIAHAIIADEIVKAINAQKGTSFPEPNVATALFTPNLPPAPASIPSGLFWLSLLAQAPPTEGIAVSLPEHERSAPVIPGRPTRRSRGEVKRSEAGPD